MQASVALNVWEHDDVRSCITVTNFMVYMPPLMLVKYCTTGQLLLLGHVQTVEVSSVLSDMPLIVLDTSECITKSIGIVKLKLSFKVFAMQGKIVTLTPCI